MKLSALVVATLVCTAVANIPTESGVFRQLKIKSKWDAIDKARLNDLHEGIKSGDIRNEDIIDAHLRELPDVTDDDGRAVPFDQAREAMKAHPAVSNALVSAFFNSVNGVRQKN